MTLIWRKKRRIPIARLKEHPCFTWADPKGLSKILNGILVIPPGDGRAYITADTNDPSELIFIPLFRRSSLEYRLLHMTMSVLIPGADDKPVLTKCTVLSNKHYTEEDFTWVGDKVSGCWAYYRVS